MIAKTIPAAIGLRRVRSRQRRCSLVEPPCELLAHHQLDGAVELAGEPRRRLLADLAHPLVERRRRDLRVALDLALGDALEPLGLAPLELDQRQLEPRAGVGLRLLDALGDRRLPRPQPLGDLLDRAAPLDRVRLELVERLGHRRGRCALELLAEPHDGPPLLVARRPELGRLALDPRLDLGDRLLLALGETGELAPRDGAAPARGRRRRPAAARRAVARPRRACRREPSLARRSRSAKIARRSSPSRRSSAASCEIVSARSRASVRRISSDVRRRLLRARRPGSRRARRRRARRSRRPRSRVRQRASQRHDRGDDRGGEAGGEDPDDHAGNAIGGTRRARPRSGSSRRRAASARPPGAATSVSRVTASRPPSASSSSPVTRDDLAAASPDGRREPALGEREERSPSGGEHGRRADRAGAGDVARDDRERAPGEREPEVGVEAAAEQLEVVGRDEERADRDQRQDPEAEADRDDDPDRAGRGDRDDRERDEHARRDRRLQRPARRARRARGRRCPSRGRRRAR